MNNKRNLLFLLLLSMVILGAVSAVSASDLNSTDVQTSQDDEIALEQIDSNQEILKTDENQENILTDGAKSYSDLNRTINGNTDSLIVLNDDYTYNSDTDSAFLNGIAITRNLTIDGNGHTINGNSKACGIHANETVLLKNIKFIYCGDPNKSYSGTGSSGRAVTSDYVDYFYADVEVINCSFEYCYGLDGGAVGGVTARDCNFTNCRAQYGGATFDTSAYNCRFLNNHAAYSGGAMEYGTAYDCYFEGNVAEGTSNQYGGGALLYAACENCTFVRNSGRNGGAIYLDSDSYIVNSTFIENSASSYGGAIYTKSSSVYIIDCDFKQNKASSSGYTIYSTTSSASIVCCRFNGNTGGTTYRCSSKWPTFSIASNPLEVLYPNVSIPINISYSYKYYQYNRAYSFKGFDVTIKVYNYTNYNLISTESAISGSTWDNSLGLGTYNIQLSSSIYGNSIGSSFTYRIVGYSSIINVSSPTLDVSSNKLYVVQGNETYLIVTLTNETGNPLEGRYIKVTREGYYTKRYPTDENGQVMIPLHTFELPEYSGSCYYLTVQAEGSTTYEPSQTVGFNLYVKKQDEKWPKSFTDLNRTINNNTDSLIVLDDDYSFNEDTDAAFLMGIPINRAVTIDGNGHTIDGFSNSAKGFMTGNYVITFNNITFVNLGKVGDGYRYNGGAISGSSYNGYTKAQNCEFIGCKGYGGGAVYYASVENCTFRGCMCSSSNTYGGAAIYSFTTVVNCYFENNGDSYSYGVLAQATAINCTFTNNRGGDGGAIYSGSAINSTFIGNRAYSGGAIGGYDWKAINCTFINNTASYGGAVYAYAYSSGLRRGYAVDCYFENNRASQYGGAAYRTHLILCTFKDNSGSGNNDYYNVLFPEVSMQTATVYGNYPSVALPLDLYYYSTRAIPSMYYPGYYYHFKGISLNLAVYKDGQFIGTYQGLSNGDYKINLEPGTYTISVSFANPSAYGNPISPNTFALVVKGYKTVINATDFVMKIGSTANITATLIGDYYGVPIANKTLTVVFDGNHSTLTTDDNGQINISVPVLPARSYPVNIYFDGDAVYEGCVNDISVLVDKIHTQISAENVSTFYNEGKLTANLADEYGNPLSNADVLLTVSYIQRPLKTNDKGEIEFYLEGLGLAEGNHEAKFVFSNNATHGDSAKSINVNIYRLKSTLEADNVSYVYGESGILTAYLKDYAGNPLSNYEVYLLLDSYFALQITDSNGQVDFDLSNRFYPGIFEGNIYFDNVNRYYGSTIPVNVTVGKISTEISAHDVSCTYGDDEYLTITLKDKYGNPIANETVFANMNIKLLTGKTDDEGQVRFLIDLPPKTYYGYVGYSGSNILMPSNYPVTVVVNQVNEKIPTEIISNDLTTVYNEGKYLTITLKDNYGDVMSGKELVINFNGQTKTYKTDKKGQVKLATSSLVPGKYPAKMTFLGDNNYQASSFSVNLIIKKANPYLFPSKKKFNKKTKVKKYKVTLKTNRNVAMKKVKLTLTVKGKTYTAKTNKKGQAIFKLKKLTKKGTYKAVVTYDGNSCYNKVVKNAKIKVK